jgi:large subunit ribosomal protein L13
MPAEVERRWWLLDAQDKVLGRLATRIARLLTGRGKPTYTPHLDCGDFVVVVNAEKVRVTGRKLQNKVYYHHTGYPGGLVAEPYSRLQERYPERIIVRAVKGMLPRNRLRARMLKRLKVYPGSTHPHQAQRPSSI